MIKTFELGKKALAFAINDRFDGVLFGRTVQEGEDCNLFLIYKKVRSGTDSLEGKEKVLGHYIARSPKFKSGEFTDADARRYLKSRFREFLRDVNSKGESTESGQQKHDLIMTTTKEFSRTNREILKTLQEAEEVIQDAEAAVESEIETIESVAQEVADEVVQEDSDATLKK